MTDTTQLVDGTWEITYDVVVTNTSGELASIYSLRTPSRSAATSPSTTHRGRVRRRRHFEADGTAILATDQPIDPDGVDTYTVTAHATIDQAGWDGDTLACEDGERPAAGGSSTSPM